MKISICFALIAATIVGCRDSNPSESSTQSAPMEKQSAARHFVFVPGSFHAAWCWYKMQPLLNQNGNTSLAIDLPAHGRDTTPIAQVTLDSYVDAVCRELERYTTPVVLIGHSRAGIVISQVAERMPEKIDQLVYLCAFLIPHGEPMVATALADSQSLLVSNLIFNEAEGWHYPKPDIFKDAFYNDCSEADVFLSSCLLSREPNAPVGTPLQLTPERYGKVKKSYIFTTMDQTITPAIQKQMVARTPVDQTHELKAGHSPFLSQPEALADILLEK